MNHYEYQANDSVALLRVYCPTQQVAAIPN